MLEVCAQKYLPSFALQVAFTTAQDLTILCGPSGAGKSLTLQAIAGAVQPET
jgi:molybdate transport system ATP-binding protein